MIVQFLKMNLKALAEFRTNFVIATIFMFLNDAIMFGSLILLAATYDQFGGFTYVEFVLGSTIAMFAFIFGANLFPGIRDLGGQIISGELDKMLLRPMNLYFQILTTRINPYALGEILFGIGLLLLNPISSWGFIVFYGIVGGVIMHFATLLYSLIPLYIDLNKDPSLFENIITFSFYPPTIFDNFGKLFSLFIFPGGLIAFGPLLFGVWPHFIWVYYGFTLFLLITAYIAFKVGIKRYTSAGY